MSIFGFNQKAKRKPSLVLNSPPGEYYIPNLPKKTGICLAVSSQEPGEGEEFPVRRSPVYWLRRFPETRNASDPLRWTGRQFTRRPGGQTKGTATWKRREPRKRGIYVT